MPYDFYSDCMIFDKTSKELGTPLEKARSKWNAGLLATEVGEHEDISLFDEENTFMDNGYGMKVPVDIRISLSIERQLYFGQLPVPRFSGFKDELSGKIISNAFTVGLLDPEEIERDWRRIASEKEAPVRPVITLTGVVAWAEDETPL